VWTTLSKRGRLTVGQVFSLRWPQVIEFLKNPEFRQTIGTPSSTQITFSICGSPGELQTFLIQLTLNSSKN